VSAGFGETGIRDLDEAKSIARAHGLTRFVVYPNPESGSVHGGYILERASEGSYRRIATRLAVFAGTLSVDNDRIPTRREVAAGRWDRN
jgi:hypothetical protein